MRSGAAPSILRVTRQKNGIEPTFKICFSGPTRYALSRPHLGGPPWAMGDTIDRHLTIAALHMALRRQKPPSGAIFHSDRGSQYACYDFRDELLAFGLTPSMSRSGNCWDNAPMESFFHTLKTEFVHHEDFATRTEAKLKIFEWIESFYNRERLHSSLGYKTPVAFAQEKMLEPV